MRNYAEIINMIIFCLLGKVVSVSWLLDTVITHIWNRMFDIWVNIQNFFLQFYSKLLIDSLLNQANKLEHVLRTCTTTIYEENCMLIGDHSLS